MIISQKHESPSPVLWSVSFMYQDWERMNFILYVDCGVNFNFCFINFCFIRKNMAQWSKTRHFIPVIIILSNLARFILVQLLKRSSVDILEIRYSLCKSFRITCVYRLQLRYLTRSS